jgi:hypothetical protein
VAAFPKLTDRSKPVAEPSAEPDLHICVFSAEGACVQAPLTSEPPLPDAEPLTSEPPLSDFAPLTSEPSSPLADPLEQGAPSFTHAASGLDPSGV